MSRKRRAKFAKAKRGGKLGRLAHGDATIDHDHGNVWNREATVEEIIHDADAQAQTRQFARDAAQARFGTAQSQFNGDINQHTVDTVRDTVLSDIRRKDDKLEQALRTAGLVRDERPLWDPTTGNAVGAGDSSISAIRTFTDSGRGKAFNAKYSDGSVLNEQDQKFAQQEFHAVNEWLRNGSFKLLAPQHPLMHKALEVANFQRVNKKGEPLGTANTSEMQSILMHHNWAAVLGDAPDTQGEWLLPYDQQCFEFLIEGTLHGKREAMPVLAVVNAQRPPPWMMLTLRTFSKQLWMFDRNYIEFQPDNFSIIAKTTRDEGICDLSALHRLIYRQIRATCILLEAEVAETKPLRDMNYKRNVLPKDNSSPLPKLGYSVVELADRHRTERLPPSPIAPPTRRSPRLHFRCGHWRHYANHRTRIPWTLASNADLGFIEKEYRL